MKDRIFQGLDAIAGGCSGDDPAIANWIEAFQTICWVTTSRGRPTLTADGREALRDLRADLGKCSRPERA